MRSSAPCQELLHEANAKTEFGKNLARHYGVPEAAKEKIFETIQNSTIRVGADDMNGIFDKAGLSNGVTREQVKVSDL